MSHLTAKCSDGGLRGGTMTHNAETISKMQSALQGWRPTGKGQYEARCPVHCDKHASLSVATKGDKIVVHCHAGCATDDVLAAIGMRMADVMPQKPKPARNGSNRGKRTVATYDYRDADGTLLSQAVRFDPKGFAQRRADGKWTMQGVKRVPYRLPELLAADPAKPVFVVEGEKDIDRLRSINLVATCNAGGAGKWKAEHSEHLRGRRVVILPDNDDPGRNHAEQVAKSLSGIAASVKVVHLPGLPDKGDVSDWLNAGGTKDELLRIVEAQGSAGIAEPTKDSGDPLRESLAAVIGDPNLSAWYDLRLILHKSDPVRWSLASKQFALAETGCLEFSATGQLTSKRAVENAAVEQSQRSIPDAILKRWKGVYAVLLQCVEIREVEPEERRDIVVAEAVLHCLKRGRVARDDQEPDRTGAPTQLADGSIWFQVAELHSQADSYSPRLKIEFSEVAQCLNKVAKAQRRKRRLKSTNSVMTFKVVDKAGLELLSAMVNGEKL